MPSPFEKRSWIPALSRLGATTLMLLVSPTAPSAQPRELALAIASDSPDGVRAAVRGGANLGAPVIIGGESTFEPLVLAVMAGAHAAAAAILQAGADAGTEDDLALKIAVALSDDAAIRLLHHAGRAVGTTDPPLLVIWGMRAPAPLADATRANFRNAIHADRMELSADLLRLIDQSDRSHPHLGSSDEPAAKVLATLLELGCDPNRAWDTGDEVVKPLDVAVRNGDVRAVDVLFATGAIKAARKDINQQLLVNAAKYGNSDGVKQLLASGTDARSVDPSGRLALPEAANAAVGRHLLAAGADPNVAGDEQDIPLLAAIKRAEHELVALLLSSGADPEKETRHAWALLVAAAQKEESLVLLLLEKGANVRRVDAQGRTLIHILLDFELIDAVRRLPLRKLIDAGLSLNLADGRGRTSLSAAIAQCADREVVEAFLDRGASIDDHALHLAVECPPDLFATLLDRSLLVNATQDGRTLVGRVFESTPLSAPKAVALLRHRPSLGDAVQQEQLLNIAVDSGSVAVVSALLDLGVTPNARSMDSAPLAHSIANGHEDVTIRLLEAGANATLSDQTGNYLHHALNAGHWAHPRRDQIGNCLSRVLEHGALLSTLDAAGRTPAVIAAAAGDTALQWLNRIVENARVGQTSLHSAARAGDLYRVLELLRSGANMNARDTLRRTPLTLALQLGKHDVAEALLSRGAELTLAGESDFDRTDIEFARVPNVAARLHPRLLQRQLVVLTPTTAAAVTKLQEQESQPFPEIKWTLTCAGGCTGTLVAPSAGASALGIRVSRSDAPGTSAYELVAARSIRMWGTLVTFAGEGAVTIPKCDFVVEAPECYPGVTIENPADNPEGTIVVAVQGDSGWTLSTGQTERVDRSAGDIVVRVVQPDQRLPLVMVVRLTTIAHAAPLVPSDFSVESRVTAYAALAHLWQQRDDAERVGDVVRTKTAAAAIAVASQRCWDEKYHEHALQVVKLRARDLLAISPSVFALRDAVLSAGVMTAADLDDVLKELRVINVTEADRTIVSELTNVLEELKSAADKNGKAIQVLREHLDTAVDRIISEYQAHVLELAQYAGVAATLQSPLSEQERTELRQRVSEADVFVADSAASGNGAALRAAFGLPEPRSGH